MSLFVVDDQGEVWRGDSQQLRMAFDSPFSGGEFIEYAVRNLGFAAINVYGASCQLRLRPGFIGSKASNGLRNWLQRSRVERVVLTTFDGVWRDELIQRGHVDVRLDEVLGTSPQARSDDFLSRPLSPALLAARPPVSHIVEAWPYLLTEYEGASLIRLLQSVFGEQYVIVRQPPGQSRLLFREFGDRMFTRYETWRTCAIGAPIEEQPDRAYGRWISGTYRQALDEGRPRLDSVDAIIRCPERGRYRRRYHRLIFPLATDSTGQLLVAGSFDDPTIDLRVTPR